MTRNNVSSIYKERVERTTFVLRPLITIDEWCNQVKLFLIVIFDHNYGNVCHNVWCNVYWKKTKTGNWL